MAKGKKYSASGLPKEIGTPIDLFLEKSIGVSASSFDISPEESDWAAVIKLHAFIEASLNHLLVTHFKDERLYPIFSKLDVSDQTKGKLAFIKALDLIPSEGRSFIKQFSEIRNSLVHDVKNLDFSLAEYLKKIDPEKKKKLKASMISLLAEAVCGRPNEDFGVDIDKYFRSCLIMSVASLMRRVNIICVLGAWSSEPLPEEPNPKES